MSNHEQLSMFSAISPAIDGSVGLSEFRQITVSGGFVISRDDAIKAGVKWFFTGVPCSRGHLSPRNVTQRSCLECVRFLVAEHYNKHPDRERLRAKVKSRKKKTGSAVADLGCTVEFLRAYIEERFTEEMSWENHGKVWQLDHKKPLSEFDLTERSHFLQACHYTNLQPLSIENHKEKTAAEFSRRAKVARRAAYPSSELRDTPT